MITLLTWDEFCQRTGLALLHFLWQGAAIALAIALLAACVRPGRMRYAIYLIGLAAMIACPIVTGFVVHVPRSQPLAQTPRALPAPSANAGDLPTRVGDATIPRALHLPPKEIEAAPAPVEARKWIEMLPAKLGIASPWVVSAWAVGVLVLSSRLLVGAAVLRRWRKSAIVLPPRIAERADMLIRRLGLSRSIHILASKRITQAMAIGCWRPMVLLPISLLADMPLDVVDAVIAHELAHIRRLDLWVNLLQRIIETLLFYHPAVWWLSNRIRIERELCCDEAAVAVTGRRLEYATSLEFIAVRGLGMPAPALSAGIGGRDRALLHRVRHVLGMSDSRREWAWPAGIAGIAVVSVALLTAIPHGSVGGAQLVTISAAEPSTRPANEQEVDESLKVKIREAFQYLPAPDPREHVQPEKIQDVLRAAAARRTIDKLQLEIAAAKAERDKYVILSNKARAENAMAEALMAQADVRKSEVQIAILELELKAAREDAGGASTTKPAVKLIDPRPAPEDAQFIAAREKFDKAGEELLRLVIEGEIKTRKNRNMPRAAVEELERKIRAAELDRDQAQDEWLKLEQDRDAKFGVYYISGVPGHGAYTTNGRPVTILRALIAARLDPQASGQKYVTLTHHEPRPSLFAPYDGEVRSVNVRRGDRVKAGDVLAKLNVDKLEIEYQDYMQAARAKDIEAKKMRVEAKTAEFNAADAERRLNLARGARIKYDIDRAEIKAPVSGMIMRAGVQQAGEHVKEGQLLLEIAPDAENKTGETTHTMRVKDLIENREKDLPVEPNDMIIVSDKPPAPTTRPTSSAVAEAQAIVRAAEAALEHQKIELQRIRAMGNAASRAEVSKAEALVAETQAYLRQAETDYAKLKQSNPTTRPIPATQGASTWPREAPDDWPKRLWTRP